MDRGVKIAIFVASIASLGLGLIWDQVLSNAREAVKTEVTDEMGPEIKEGKIGSPDLEKMEVVNNDSPEMPRVVVVDNQPVKPIEPVEPKIEEWLDYTVQKNDSWWRIANRRFKGRGLSSTDILNANPKVKNLRPGQKIKIPPSKAS